MNEYLLQAIQENEDDGYLKYHAPRYQVLLNLLQKYYTGNDDILDVGRSPFSEIANRFLGTDIDTLGFEADKKTETGFNYHFDLNDSQVTEKWRRDIPQYDIIVFSEVIEHLYTSPELVLKFLKSLLKVDGIIIIQTPNAVALHKRVKLLFGKNPYHLISKNTENPAHFREYTAEELTDYCKEAGFQIVEKTIKNYFDYRYREHADGSPEKKSSYRLLNIMFDILPSSLRPGLCFVIRSD